MNYRCVRVVRASLRRPLLFLRQVPESKSAAKTTGNFVGAERPEFIEAIRNLPTARRALGQPGQVRVPGIRYPRVWRVMRVTDRNIERPSYPVMNLGMTVGEGNTTGVARGKKFAVEGGGVAEYENG